MRCTETAPVLGKSQRPEHLGPDRRLNRLAQTVYERTEQWGSIRNKRFEFEGEHPLDEPECQSGDRNQNSQRGYEPGGYETVRRFGNATQIEQMLA